MRKPVSESQTCLARALWIGALAAATSVSSWAANVEIQVRDDAGRPVQGAAVFLDSAAAKQAVRPLEGIEVAQEQKKFVPDVLTVTVGTQVQFPNRDAVRHQVYSFSPAKKFELKLYKGTPSVPVRFDQPGVVVLGCNIHDQMVGWILVVETPYYGNTAASGRATLANVPPGNYRLRTWHNGMAVGAPALDKAFTVSADASSNRAEVILTGLVP